MLLDQTNSWEFEERLWREIDATRIRALKRNLRSKAIAHIISWEAKEITIRSAREELVKENETQINPSCQGLTITK